MTTHTILKSDIATYLARDDLTDVIPTLVRLGEARIAKDIRVSAMEDTSALTISGQSGVAVPDGFLAVRRIYVQDATHFEIEYLSPVVFWDTEEAHVSGYPKFYTLEGNKFKFAPYPSSTIYASLVHFKRFDALSGEEDTNWLLTNHYDVYLYACLAEAKAYIEDDEQAGKWATAYSNAKDSVNRNNIRASRGLSFVRTSRVP